MYFRNTRDCRAPPGKVGAEGLQDLSLDMKQ